MSGEATGFRYRVHRNGDVAIDHHGRTACVVRAASAARFLTEVSTGEPQQVMARWTGNYRHGNERAARRHARNQDR